MPNTSKPKRPLAHAHSGGTAIAKAMPQALALVDEKGEPRIDSHAIAYNIGRRHRSVISLINTHKSDFETLGKVRFQMAPSTTGRTGQAIRFALLNEDHCYLLLAYSRNNERTRALKVKLVAAFGSARREAQQRQTEYLPQYHHLHDHIKELARGSESERHVHVNVNRLVNKVAGIEAGQRHAVPVALLTAVNHVAAIALEGARDHKDGYQRVKAALTAMAALMAPQRGLEHG